MEQIEVISWKTLDAIKKSATKIYDVIGSLETNEQMAVFCAIEEDYLELYYSEVDANYIRHFEDEDEFYKLIEIRKKEFGEEHYDSIDFYDDENYDDDSGDDYDEDYSIRGDDEEEDF